MYSRRFREKGIISQDLLQGFSGEKRKISCWMFCGSVVQWFSGMLFCCAGSALYNTKTLFGFTGNRRRSQQG
jgi:hypothetical protein